MHVSCWKFCFVSFAFSLLFVSLWRNSMLTLLLNRLFVEYLPFNLSLRILLRSPSAQCFRVLAPNNCLAALRFPNSASFSPTCACQLRPLASSYQSWLGTLIYILLESREWGWRRICGTSTTTPSAAMVAGTEGQDSGSLLAKNSSLPKSTMWWRRPFSTASLNCADDAHALSCHLFDLVVLSCILFWFTWPIGLAQVRSATVNRR